jgi:TRAP-type C4-dicarboxylate transport system permease small subunit
VTASGDDPPVKPSPDEPDPKADGEVHLKTEPPAATGMGIAVAAAFPEPHVVDHFADEPPLARSVRRIDEAVGAGERAGLFAAFSVLVLVSLYRTFIDMFAGERPLWAIEIVRLSAFSIGMLGAAYATQSRRNFGLDLVSALFPIKVKAMVRVFTNLAALFAGALLFHGGRLIQHALTKEKQHYEVIPTSAVGWLIPVCAVLIMFHVTLHIVIEIDYLRQGKTAPEPEVAG